MTITYDRIQKIRDLAAVQKVDGMLIQEGELTALCDMAMAWLRRAIGDDYPPGVPSSVCLSREERAIRALRELHATVRGECPQLLNEDSGGNASLDLEIEAVLALPSERAEQTDRLESALLKIAQWGDAYPLSVFPEPDLKKAAEILKAGGMTLDAISASNMRHVVQSASNIAKDALGLNNHRHGGA